MKKRKKNGNVLVYYVMVLCQQQQTMKKNSILSKHAKTGSRGLMFFLLQQPEDNSVSGLHLSLKDSVRSANFSFEWTESAGLGSDGTNANKCFYELEKEDIGDHLISLGAYPIT